MSLARSFRLAGGVAGVALLASCLHFPPSVAPTASLAPAGGKGGGPRTGSAFAVAYAAPRGTVTELRDPAVTVLFNRSMRALESAEDEALPPLEVRTAEGAKVPGRLRWVGTRGLLFTPEDALPAATRFTVAVPAETRALDGAALGAAYAFEFSTLRPAVMEVAAATRSTWVLPDAGLTVRMNQEIAPEALEKAARLVLHRADGDAGEPVSFHAARLPSPRIPVAGVAYQIKPDRPLPLDVGVELTIAAGLRGAAGPLAMESPHTFRGRTYGPLRLASFHCPRIAADARCVAHNDVQVTLTNPVAPDELKRHLRAPGLLSTAKPQKKPRAQRPPPESAAHWIGADPQHGRKYKVTLTAGMKDVYGQVLAKDATFEIEVEPPFTGGAPAKAGPAKAAAAAPSPTPRDPGAPDPAIPHRPTLPYELRLGLSGHVLEALATTGVKSHKLPIGSVNIPTYQLTAARVSEAQALAWISGTSLGEFLARNQLAPTFVSPGAAENVRAVRDVDLDALLGKGARGAAFVALAVPGGTATQQLVRVTDLGVTAKASRYGSAVWVTSLGSGKPVAGATVSLRTAEKGELLAVPTDDRGLAEIPASRFDPFAEPKKGMTARETAYLFVKSGDDWTFQPLTRAHTDQRVAGSFQDFRDHGAALGMIYTDRGVYRPGEIVKVAGLFRTVDAAAMRSPAGEEVRLEARDGSGEVVSTTRVLLDRFGAFAADVRVPKTAHLGDARLVAVLRGRGHTADTSQEFQLAAYQASEFAVEVEADGKERVRGDEVTFSARASFLFGGAMAGAKAHTTVTRSHALFTPPGAADLITTEDASLLDQRETSGRVADLGGSDETLDAEGRAARRLRLAMPGQAGPERVVFEAEVEDLSRRTIAQRASVLVHPAEFYVAQRPLARRFVDAGGSVRAEVLAIEPSGQHRAGALVHVDLLQRKWIAAVEERGEGAHRTSRFIEEVVAGCDVRTAADARGCDLKIPDAGSFVLRASAQDPRGNVVRSSQAFYAVENAPRPGRAPVAWAASDARAVRLELDKKAYDPGETARVMVESPFREAEALVTVERNGLLSRSVVHLSGPMPVIDLAVTADMYPNVYVGVHLLRGRVGAPPEKGADLGGPEFRMGYVELPVNHEAHRLAVTVAPDRKEHRPGDEIDVDVTVLDRAGKPVESEVTFYAVDEGVLMLTAYRTPDPLPAFAKQRPLAVFTAESREDLAQIVQLKAGERLPNLGWEYARRGDKGYPGGGGAGGMRADFRSTAHFEAGKVTSREGKARVHFKLPDNLTTFRLMAVAASEGDFFGAGEAKVTTARKLMARPALPRFLRVGDDLEASVVISAKDLGEADVDVTASAQGAQIQGDRRRRVRLPKTGSVEARFPVRVTAPGAITFDFALEGGGERDSVRVERRAHLPLSLERASAYGEVTEAAAVSLGDLAGIRADQGSLELRVAPTALVGLAGSVESLLDYPYGCTEQLTSRLLPLVSLADLAREVGAHLPADVPHAVEEAVDGILQNQRSDGGFGFWPDSPRSEPWLSAYVLHTLHTAAKAGHAVPASALESAEQYLRAQLKRSKLVEEEETEERPEDPAPDRDGAPEDVERVDYANGAFMADALASIGAADPGLLTRLYDARKGKSLASRALVLHALAAAKMSPDLLANLAREIEAELRVEAGEAVARAEEDAVARAVVESQARTTALALRGLVAADRRHPLAPRLARGLLGLRERGAWRSTQENGWALLALRDYRAAQEASKRDVEARVFLGSSLVATRSFAGAEDAELKASIPAAELLGARGPVTFQALGQGPLFYAAELRYATAALPKEGRDQGLFVKKMLRALGPEELAEATEWLPRKSAEQATAGSLVLIDLLLESAEARRQVVIDDPLPAGLAPIDTALDTASRSRRAEDHYAGEAHSGKARPGELTGIGAAFRSAHVHREMHDDRVLTFIEDLPPGMYHFRYLARAESIGRFVVPPTRVEAMYTPEVWGSTAAGTFEVKAKP